MADQKVTGWHFAFLSHLKFKTAALGVKLDGEYEFEVNSAAKAQFEWLKHWLSFKLRQLFVEVAAVVELACNSISQFQIDFRSSSNPGKFLCSRVPTVLFYLTSSFIPTLWSLFSINIVIFNFLTFSNSTETVECTSPQFNHTLSIFAACLLSHFIIHPHTTLCSSRFFRSIFTSHFANITSHATMTSIPASTSHHAWNGATLKEEMKDAASPLQHLDRSIATSFGRLVAVSIKRVRSTKVGPSTATMYLIINFWK